MHDPVVSRTVTARLAASIALTVASSLALWTVDIRGSSAAAAQRSAGTGAAAGTGDAALDRGSADALAISFAARVRR
jgi:hypothetical protein